MAFAAAAVAAAGGSVTIGPLSPTSSQGDRAICAILRRRRTQNSRFSGEELEISGRMTRPFEADLTATPDLFPALVVVGGRRPPGIGVGRDRASQAQRERPLDGDGGESRSTRRGLRSRSTSLVVRKGIERNHPGVIRVTAADDHRVAMAMAVAALVAGELELDDGSCVGKSYPGFWNMWDTLG